MESTISWKLSKDAINKEKYRNKKGIKDIRIEEEVKYEETSKAS